MMTKHLSIQQPSNRTWCGWSPAGWRDPDTYVAFARNATCEACLKEYIRRAWAPDFGRPAMCQPANDHCDQQVAREGDLCAGHANAAAQYACE